MLSPESYLNKKVEVTLEDSSYFVGIFMVYATKKPSATYYFVVEPIDPDATDEALVASRPFKFSEVETIKVVK